MFTLKLLGGVSLSGPAGPLQGRVAQRRQLALLALLGGSRTPSLSREKVVTLLWPESPSRNARSSLSDTLHVLHKALGPEVVLQAREDLWLNPEVVRCDVQVFWAALREERWEEALALYQGPFLEEFHFSGTEELESWAEGERDRVRREAREAADRLVAARELMGLLEAAGDRAGAVEAYEAFARGLRTELELEPSPETVALAQAIREGGAPHPLRSRRGRRRVGAKALPPPTRGRTSREPGIPRPIRAAGSAGLQASAWWRPRYWAPFSSPFASPLGEGIRCAWPTR